MTQPDYDPIESTLDRMGVERDVVDAPDLDAGAATGWLVIAVAMLIAAILIFALGMFFERMDSRAQLAAAEGAMDAALVAKTKEKYDLAAEVGQYQFKRGAFAWCVEHNETPEACDAEVERWRLVAWQKSTEGLVWSTP